VAEPAKDEAAEQLRRDEELKAKIQE